MFEQTHLFSRPVAFMCRVVCPSSMLFPPMRWQINNFTPHRLKTSKSLRPISSRGQLGGPLSPPATRTTYPGGFLRHRGHTGCARTPALTHPGGALRTHAAPSSFHYPSWRSTHSTHQQGNHPSTATHPIPAHHGTTGLQKGIHRLHSRCLRTPRILPGHFTSYRLFRALPPRSQPTRWQQA